MPKRPDIENMGMLVAERLLLHQEEPHITVNRTTLRISLAQRRNLQLTGNKVHALVLELSTVPRDYTGQPWFHKQGNSLQIGELDKVLRDHRSASALLVALEMSKQDESQTKIVFDIQEWQERLKQQYKLQAQLCQKFLIEYRFCGYTEAFTKNEEEITRDLINQEKNILVAISKYPELINVYD